MTAEVLLSFAGSRLFLVLGIDRKLDDIEKHLAQFYLKFEMFSYV